MPVTYASRLVALRRRMEVTGTEAVLLSLGSDLPYFSGYTAMPLERVTMLVVRRDGDARLFVPELEAPRVMEQPGIQLIPWKEGDDPLDLIAADLAGSRLVAVADETWAGFVLGLQARLPAVAWRSADSLTRELRMRKSAEELESLRAAGAAADRVADHLRTVRFAGRSEHDISRELSELLIQAGHESVDFAIVASGPNSASPHHEPGGRTLLAGDPVVLDFGGSKEGYKSDTSRTVHVGPPNAEFVEVFGLVRAAQAAAVEAVRPGISAQEVDRAARHVIAEAGYGQFFIHRTGHGIGRDTHEHPYIIEGNETILEPGMAFSVEPGIYLPGRFGVRIEDIVAVTEDGVERLNLSDRDLVIV